MAKKIFYTEELGQLVASNADGSLETIYHVHSILSGKWIVRRHGKRRASRVFPTQKEAVAFGKKYAMAKDATTLVIHNEDATIKREIVLNPKKNSSLNGVRK